VDFNGRNTHGRDGVPQRNTRVSVSGGVDDDGVEIVLGLLDPTDEFAFSVGLAEVNGRAERVRPATDARLNVGESCLAVNIGLPVP
jgi:hypothetical protein